MDRSSSKVQLNELDITKVKLMQRIESPVSRSRSRGSGHSELRGAEASDLTSSHGARGLRQQHRIRGVYTLTLTQGGETFINCLLSVLFFLTEAMTESISVDFFACVNLM